VRHPLIQPDADGRNPEPACSQIVAVGTGKVVNTLPGVRLFPNDASPLQLQLARLDLRFCHHLALGSMLSVATLPD